MNFNNFTPSLILKVLKYIGSPKQVARAVLQLDENCLKKVNNSNIHYYHESTQKGLPEPLTSESFSHLLGHTVTTTLEATAERIGHFRMCLGGNADVSFYMHPRPSRDYIIVPIFLLSLSAQIPLPLLFTYNTIGEKNNISNQKCYYY